jgi:excisionase family DNA binding protein
MDRIEESSTQAARPALAELAPLLTPNDVAKRLAVSRSMIYALIHRRDLPAVYIGRLPRVRESDLIAYVQHASSEVPR